MFGLFKKKAPREATEISPIELYNDMVDQIKDLQKLLTERLPEDQGQPGTDAPQLTPPEPDDVALLVRMNDRCQKELKVFLDYLDRRTEDFSPREMLSLNLLLSNMRIQIHNSSGIPFGRLSVYGLIIDTLYLRMRTPS